MDSGNPHAMTTTAPSQPSSPVLQKGEGYLAFMGYLQIAGGTLTVLFSILAMLKAWSLSGMAMMSPGDIYQAFGGHGEGSIDKLIAGYLSFLVMFGWVLGLMMITAGVCCLKRTGRRWVTVSSVLNLITLPHATTIAIMVLHGMTRRGIAAAFR